MRDKNYLNFNKTTELDLPNASYLKNCDKKDW